MSTYGKTNRSKNNATDEYYTPPDIYEMVGKELVHTNKKIVRPFWLGGDYKKTLDEMDPSEVFVYDNPPFSCLSEILDYLNERGFEFVLFGDGLRWTGYSNRANIILGDGIVYENQRPVCTCFLTNGSGKLIVNRSLLRKLYFKHRKYDLTCTSPANLHTMRFVLDEGVYDIQYRNESKYGGTFSVNV